MAKKKKKVRPKVKPEDIILKFEEEPVNLSEIVDRVIAKYPKLILEYRSGIKSSLDRLISEVMRECKGKADPRKVKLLILEKL